MDVILQNWWLLAALAPLLMAIVCLFDSCLVGNDIYQNPLEGVVVSCFLSIIPVIGILVWFSPSIRWELLAQKAALSAIGAALAYVIYLVFYFRALFSLNDVSGTETFVTLSVLIVPFFAWILLDEVLPPRFYLVFSIAAVGVLIHCIPLLRGVGPGLLVNLGISVIAVSLAMVLQANALGSLGYANATVVFNLSSFVAAILIVLPAGKIRMRVFTIARRVPTLLIVTECFGLLALACSHRATQVSPSVSFVALVECILPLLIVLLSLTLIGLNRIVPVLSRANYATLVLQVTNMPSKLIALLLLVTSVSMLG